MGVSVHEKAAQSAEFKIPSCFQYSRLKNEAIKVKKVNDIKFSQYRRLN